MRAVIRNCTLPGARTQAPFAVSSHWMHLRLTKSHDSVQFALRKARRTGPESGRAENAPVPQKMPVIFVTTVEYQRGYDGHP